MNEEDRPNRVAYLGVLAIASFVEGSAATVYYLNLEDPRYADLFDKHGSDSKAEVFYAILAGVLGFLIAVGAIALSRLAPELSTKLNPIFACFLSLWWGVAAGILTFDLKPFMLPGNGYFSVWTCFFVSVAFAASSVHGLGDAFSSARASFDSLDATRQALVLMLASSVVELASASRLCQLEHDCSKSSGWAVAVGVISCFFCVALLLLMKFSPPTAEQIQKVVSLFMLVLWTCGVTVTTFVNPFLAASNGYFSSWLAFMSALSYAAASFPALRSGLDQAKRVASARWSQSAFPPLEHSSSSAVAAPPRDNVSFIPPPSANPTPEDGYQPPAPPAV